jgi:hypothetical protein
MSERRPHQELGHLARISGEVRAASARWEVELHCTLLSVPPKSVRPQHHA